jgi:hypothetical protein
MEERRQQGRDAFRERSTRLFVERGVIKCVRINKRSVGRSTRNQICEKTRKISQETTTREREILLVVVVVVQGR